jgi:hypothetical protein
MNPFSYGSIVKDDQFYDRKEECARIVKTLSGGNNLVMYAPRRFGKTSLAFKAIKELETKGFICIYFDFMPVFSPESFVRLYSKALSARQTDLEKFVRTFASLVKSVRPLLGFGTEGRPEFSIDFAGATVDETVVSQLLDVPGKMAGGKRRIILFFDEFQEVEKLSSIHFEDLLRSKIQQQKGVNYLFFGSKTHIMNELFNDRKRAFYNAASQMTIGYLPEQDSINYLQRKFSDSNIRLNTEVAGYMLKVTANIPHYIQLLAAEVWQYMINNCRDVTFEIVNDCADRILVLKNDYYMELFDRQSQSKKQLIQALAVSGKNIFSTAFISTHRLPGAATLQRAIKGLVQDGIVEKMNDEYFIADPFFKMFVTTI